MLVCQDTLEVGLERLYPPPAEYGKDAEPDANR